MNKYTIIAIVVTVLIALGIAFYITDKDNLVKTQVSEIENTNQEKENATNSTNEKDAPSDDIEKELDLMNQNLDLEISEDIQ